ncbi:MAG: putative PEP-CTERM system TPR-repeat lipoprotein, partial [Gammaproteobacteria bacterium]
ADPQHVTSVLLLSQIDYKQASYEAAVQRLRPFLVRFTNNVPGRKLFAAALVALKQSSEALEILGPMEKVLADDAVVHQLLGVAYAQSGDAARAKRHLTRANELAPNVSHLELQLALSHLSAGEPSTAIDKLKATAGRGRQRGRAQSLLILALIDEGDLDRAFTEAQRLVELYPGDPKAYNALGAVHDARGDRVAAAAQYRRALAVDGTYITAAVNLGRALMRSGDSEGARAAFQKMLEQHAHSPLALVGLAQLALRQGKSNSAELLLQQARAQNPKALDPRLMLVSLRLRTGDRAGALELSREAARIAPNAPGVLRALGTALLENRQVDDALAAFRRLAKLTPGSADAQFRLALAQERKGDATAMAASLRRVVAIQPNHMLAKVGLGKFELAHGDANKGLALGNEVVKQFPTAMPGHLLVGEASITLNKVEQGLRALRKAHEIIPITMTMERLHDAMLVTGNADGAGELVKSWVQEHPEDNGARMMLASSYERIGDLGLAALEYERILYNTPQHPFALNNLAWLMYQRRNPKALPMAEKAFKRLPKHPQIADTFGWILAQSGKADRALRVLAHALSRAPGDLSIRFHHAATLVMVGKPRDAREALEKILSSKQLFAERGAAKALLARLPR